VTSNDDITIRPAAPSDLYAVVDLVNACSVAEGGTPDETPENLRSYWAAPGFDLSTDAWAVVAPGRRLVGYEQVEVGDGSAPLELDGYVHPEFVGRGIGARLLGLAECRARQALADLSARGSLPLRGTIASANARARELFTGQGFHAIRHFWRMQIDFETPPAPPEWPEGVAVRGFVRGHDERAAYEAIEEAFADHWEHTRLPFDEWVRARTQRDDFDPSLWFLALEGGEAAGAALCYPRGERFGWVRGLGVRRPWRGRGVGMALLRHAFGAFYARGYRGAGLGVDASSPTGATRLYERAGMRVTEQYETYEKTIEA
jgi:mycothiol synthase